MSKYAGKIVTNQAPAGYSVYFDGTGDYLSLPNDAAFSGIGSNDWTVEAWVYSTATATSQNIITISGSSSAFAAIRLELSTANALYLVSSITGSAWAIDYAAGTITVNAWNHVAVTRSGTSVRLYVNGSQVGVTQTLSGSLMSGTVNRIGIVSNDSSFPFRGYISNVRYIRGTALYTGTTYLVPTQLLNVTNTQLLTCNSPALVDQSTNNFTITANGNAAVSTFTPFTAYNPYNPALGASTPGVWTLDEALQAAGTRQWNMYDPSFNLTTLLLHGNPTNGTAWLTDVSTNNFALTTNGDAKPANLSPFSLTTYGTSGSGYFDGTGDYLSNTSAALISNTVSTFTVECWLYLTANPPANGNDISAMCTLDGQPTGPTNFMSFGPKDNRRLYLFWFDGSVKSAVGGTVLALNTWYHIVCVVNSNAIQFYVNGVAETMTGTTTLTNRSGSQGNFAIGSSSAGQITGYISNFRVTTTAVYTGAFTTPTAPLTAISGTRILTLQNSQSANNNAFLDSSSNNFTITRNGNTTQGSFSPFSQAPGYWGNYFDGNSWLSIPSTSNLAFGTGDFCVEFWFYQAGAAAKGIFSNSTGAGGGDTQFEIQINVSSKIVLLGWNSIFLTGATTINAGSWYHIAVLRSGTSMAMFVNGVRDATATSANNFSSTNSFEIGRQATGSGGGYITGYISNLRAVKGASVYSPSSLNITVPTVPLGATSGGQTPPTGTQTSLLTCQSSRFVDNGGLVTPNTVTPNGTPSVQAFSPFYPTAAYTPATVGGSGYFDGTTDWLSIANNAAFDLGTGDCTVECWLYRATSGTLQGIVTAFPSGGTPINGWGLYINTSNFVYMDSWVGNVEQTFTASDNAIPVNAWTHIAYTRQSGTSRLFVNGRLCTATGPLTQAINTGGFELQIGRSNYGATNYVTGYISNLRIVKGTAVYTAAFTPATAPLTAITNTSLLTNFTNAGIVDSTGKNALETVGNAQISTAVSRFGGSSMYFDGTGDDLLLPSSPIRALGTADFTIEFWFNASSIPTFAAIIDMRNPNTDNAGFDIMFYFNKLAFGTATFPYITGVTTLSTGTWYHYALTRSGNVFRQFLNGVQEGSTYNGSTTQNFTNTILRIANGSNGPYTGYLDDIRITRGAARYTGNFTPQTSQWQDQ